jgi:hypothetical protein
MKSTEQPSQAYHHEKLTAASSETVVRTDIWSGMQSNKALICNTGTILDTGKPRVEP